MHRIYVKVTGALAKVRVPGFPMPAWVHQMPGDLYSIFTMTPVVFLVFSFVVVGMWYDMQARFSRVGREILNNQQRIMSVLDAAQEAKEASQVAQSDISSARGEIASARAQLAEIRGNGRVVGGVLRRTRAEAERARVAEEQIRAADRQIEASARAIEEMRASSEEALRQSRDNSQRITRGDADLVNALNNNDRMLMHRLEDVLEEIRKLDAKLSPGERR